MLMLRPFQLGNEAFQRVGCSAVLLVENYCAQELCTNSWTSRQKKWGLYVIGGKEEFVHFVCLKNQLIKYLDALQIPISAIFFRGILTRFLFLLAIHTNFTLFVYGISRCCKFC